MGRALAGDLIAFDGLVEELRKLEHTEANLLRLLSGLVGSKQSKKWKVGGMSGFDAGVRVPV